MKFFLVWTDLFHNPAVLLIQSFVIAWFSFSITQPKISCWRRHHFGVRLKLKSKQFSFLINCSCLTQNASFKMFSRFLSTCSTSPANRCRRNGRCRLWLAARCAPITELQWFMSDGPQRAAARVHPSKQQQLLAPRWISSSSVKYQSQWKRIKTVCTDFI